MQLANIQRRWWKEAIVYQIYPRSFQDSNADGVGDLRGIINRLDYIASLGVDVVWLNPIYQSPNKDNGYDISDYRNIMSEFGNMADFDEMLAGFHARGIKVVMDLVVNHTSDQHEWFQQSRSSRDNPYRDFYHWWPAEKGEPPKRWSFFDEEANAWCYDEPTDAYYLHYFARSQPDLRWENPEVRRAIYDMMHFWFKKGIDGFRMDVITFISKHEGYPEFEEHYQGHKMIGRYAQGPRLHEFLHEMNREVLQHYDIMTVAEGIGTRPDNVVDLVAEDRQELNMSYHFDHHNIGVGERYILNEDFQNLVKFKQVMSEWDLALADRGWNTVYLGNHDFPRMLTRWGNDAPEWRNYSSKLLSTFLLSMRGTPFYYMGDEIGMSNIKFDTIDDYDDLMTRNWYELTRQEGGDLQQFLDSHKICARDNGRTPMQWDQSAHAGFSQAEPWIKICPNYKDINVAAQEEDPDSVLNFFRKLVQLRKENLALVYGSYKLLFPDHPQLYVFQRELDDERLLVALNFSEEEIRFEYPHNVYGSTLNGIDRGFITTVDILINNYPEMEMGQNFLVLYPWQAVVLRDYHRE